MLTKKFLAILLISISLQPSQLTIGQQSGAKTDGLKEKAYAVLVSLAGEVGTLQSAENRARLGSNIAGSLWPHDEQRARGLFTMVQVDIKNALLDPPGEDPQDILTYRVFMKLRIDTVERITKHDPLLAFEFLRATKPNWSKPLTDWNDVVQQSETMLARKLAYKHPEIAVQLGRERLARGFSQDLVQLLSSFPRKHQDQARTLYQEIVGKIKLADILKDWQTIQFVRNLGQSYVPPKADRATYRELISALRTSSTRLNCDRTNHEDFNAHVCSQLDTLIPHMEKLEREKQESVENRPNSGYVGFQDVGFSVEEILAMVTDYPEQKSELYSRAVSVALRSGELEKAKQIVEEFDGDPENKELLKGFVEGHRRRMTPTEKDLAELNEQLGAIEKPSKRASVLIYAANLVGANDRERALKFLKQAKVITEEMKPGKEQTELLIELARGYCVEKSDQGFQIMESVLPKLNELVSAAIKLDGYDAISVRGGEWNMSGEGSVGDLLTKLAQNAPHFAWLNFDRSFEMTKQFERPEIRMMAQLKLAQGILAGSQNRYHMLPPQFVH